jgi:hypothetical protein
MNKNNLLVKNTISNMTRWVLMAVLALGVLFYIPEADAAAGLLPKWDGKADSTAVTKFEALRTGMQGFAVVVLLIMLVIAAIMAAMQKITMAINVAIAAIILFGGGYIMLLIYEGLRG